MTTALYNRHQLQLNEMLEEHRVNVLEEINLSRIWIMTICYSKNGIYDHFWVRIEGSMIDYIMDEITGDIISGRTVEVGIFTEFWKFVHAPHGWVLDEIRQDPFA